MLNMELAYCLHKAFYGLKQTFQVWYQTSDDFLKKLGLKYFEHNHIILVLQNQQLYLAIYINNLLVFSFDNSCFIKFQDQLNIKFKITNLKNIFQYLSIKVNVERGRKIFFEHTNYFGKILRRFQMVDYKSAFFPINPNIANSLFLSTNQADLAIIEQYQFVIRFFIQPVMYTKPNICYLITIPSRYYANVGPVYCNLVIQIFC